MRFSAVCCAFGAFPRWVSRGGVLCAMVLLAGIAREVPAAGAAPELQSIHAILSPLHEHTGSLVTVRGTVTYLTEVLVVQDQTGAIAVKPEGAAEAVLGDEVEVTGRRVAVTGALPRLEGARVRSLWRSSSPPPIALTPDDAAVGDHDNYLVQLAGKLVRVEAREEGTRLQLEGDHQFFSALLPAAAAGGRRVVRGLEPGSEVRLTGILAVRPGQYTTTDGSFAVLLRTPADVEVVHGPPWTTTPHLLLLLGGVVLLAVLVQVAHVRSVRRQFAAILAERARIARDIHDTLAQGFAGIALQLEVVKGELGRDRAGAELHLETALGMVRHSRAEAHRSIATLRAFAQPVELPEMLRVAISGAVRGSGTRAHLELPPLATALRQEVAEHLFRICQEAVVNALQHAGARNLWVSLAAMEPVVELVVRDDGRGFDRRALAGAPPVHFGLIGMEERAARVGAELCVESGAEGTVVRVRLREESRPVGVWSRLRGWAAMAGRVSTTMRARISA